MSFNAYGRQVMEEHVKKLLTDYGDLLYRISFSIVGNGADAEDMVQDAFVTYTREAPSFQDDGHERQWLIKVVRNNSLMFLRKNKNRERILEEYAGMNVGSPADYGIMEALKQVSEKYRTVLILHYVEEYRVEEIAGMLGKSVSAIKMRLKRGRAILAEKYKEYA